MFGVYEAPPVPHQVCITRTCDNITQPPSTRFLKVFFSAERREFIEHRERPTDAPTRRHLSEAAVHSNYFGCVCPSCFAQLWCKTGSEILPHGGWCLILSIIWYTRYVTQCFYSDPFCWSCAKHTDKWSRHSPKKAVSHVKKNNSSKTLQKLKIFMLSLRKVEECWRCCCIYLYLYVVVWPCLGAGGASYCTGVARLLLAVTMTAASRTQSSVLVLHQSTQWMVVRSWRAWRSGSEHT